MKCFTFATLTAVVALTLVAGRASADPLSGEVLKFQQLPLNNRLAPSAGGAPYPGHDEWSTALGNAAGYQGDFMADDFSDTANTAVFHVRWWGSYSQNQNFNGVQKFLVAFESDMPNDPTINASRPDQVLSTEIVTLGALSPGSGTFTETLINGNAPEHLYQYNAELALPFAEQANTVYWLKIVALVDPLVDGAIKWGWHDRDWSLQNTLASPTVNPGEAVIGTVVDPNGVPQPVWHFQDDAVSGRLTVLPNTAGGVNIQQSSYNPENYVFIPGAVPIDGPFGIQNFSKDLAFELYTRPTPEPGTLVMLSMGGVGLAIAAWRKRRTK